MNEFVIIHQIPRDNDHEMGIQVIGPFDSFRTACDFGITENLTLKGLWEVQKVIER